MPVSTDNRTVTSDTDKLRLRLTKAEVSLQARQHGTPVDDDLRNMGWYLHSVGTTKADFSPYDSDLRGEANLLSAHIFRASVKNNTMSDIERCRQVLAAQVGYVLAGHQNQATVLAEQAHICSPSLSAATSGRVSLEITILSAARNVDRLTRALVDYSQQIAELQKLYCRLEDTALNAAVQVIQGAENLCRWHQTKNPVMLDQALECFNVATASDTCDCDSRWCAALMPRLYIAEQHKKFVCC